MNIKFSKRTGGQYLIKDFLISNLEVIPVFEKFEINYSNSANKNLKEVCEEKGLNTDIVFKELKSLINTSKNEHEKFDDWDLRKLIDYLISDHNTLTNINAASITKNLQEASAIWGKTHTEIVEIELLFSQLLKDFLIHISNEEKFLFHVIRYLVDCKKFNEKPKISGFKTVKNPIARLEADHYKNDAAINKIKLVIKELLKKERVPELINSVCDEILNFDRNFQLHIHLENNILFPKSIELENSLLQNRTKN